MICFIALKIHLFKRYLVIRKESLKWWASLKNVKRTQQDSLEFQMNIHMIQKNNCRATGNPPNSSAIFKQSSQFQKSYGFSLSLSKWSRLYNEELPARQHGFDDNQMLLSCKQVYHTPWDHPYYSKNCKCKGTTLEM